MTDGPELVDLVAAAAAGDQRAWDRLVDRFMPLIRSIARSFRLSPSERDDISQAVWLRLVEHLARIRDPQCLPGWISTTTRNECLSLIRTRRRTDTYGDLEEWETLASDIDPTEALVREQFAQALREGLAELPDRQRKLLLLLLEDPPVSYDEISLRLDMPMGSIGPTRARALQRLRGTRPMLAVFGADAECSQ